MTETDEPGSRVGSFRIVRQIGSGQFSDVYLGASTITNEEVAIKIEDTKIEHSQLEHEAKIYKSLFGGVGIPFIRALGTTDDGKYNAMAFELQGPSVVDVKDWCKTFFSLRTVLWIADQSLSRIEYMHKKGIVHRDIRPDHFYLGIGKRCNQISLGGVRLAKEYREPETLKHMTYREDRLGLTGAARYCSINVHSCVEPSRRDDIVGWIHSLISLLRPLPWQGLKAANKKELFDLILEKKRATPPEILCDGLPPLFRDCLDHGLSLGFEDPPDFEFLFAQIHDFQRTEGLQIDYAFEWTVYKYLKGKSDPPENPVIEFIDSNYKDIPLKPDTRDIPTHVYMRVVGETFVSLNKTELESSTIIEKHKASDVLPTIQDRQEFLLLHCELLYKYCDVVQAFQSPSAPGSLLDHARKYQMPARIWQQGVQSPLQVLRNHPTSREHMEAFVYRALAMIGLLHDMAPEFKDTWVKYLEELRELVAKEDDEDREEEKRDDSTVIF